MELHTVTWVDGDPLDIVGDAEDRNDKGPGERVPVIAQCSAHGRPVAGTVRRTSVGAPGSGPPGLSLTFVARQRRIAPGQTVALYDPDRPDEVVGSGIAR